MPDPQRRAILRDIGIDIWLPRDAEPDATARTDTGQMPAVSSAESSSTTGDHWLALQQQVSQCQACDLASTRTQTVFGIGNPRADLLLVGEAPGAEEDQKGEPFVGRAGKLLDAMLFAIGLYRNQVFICNVLKCRPPGNRDPKADEIEACAGYLEAQLAYVRPRVIVALGRFAGQQLLKTDAPVWRMRQDHNTLPGSDVPVFVTYHPASLLRNPAQKAKAWQDLCRIRDMLDGAA